MLMNFSRKSNFSSIIVTKKISDGRSAKARRYSIPLNSLDNTIQLTNGWRLADTKLHIFRFEITRNIFINKTRDIPAGKTLTTEELLPNMKESVGFVWFCLDVRWVLGERERERERERDPVVRLSQFNKTALWNLGEVEVVLHCRHCMTNKVGRKKVGLTWIPTEDDT